MPLSGLNPTEPMELLIELPCKVRLAIDDPIGATHISFLDPKLRQLSISYLDGSTTNVLHKLPRLPTGEFPEFQVSLRAAMLVLWAGQDELCHMGIHLKPGVMNQLEL